MTTTIDTFPRPTNSDCGEYWHTYIDQVEGNDVLATLRQGAERLDRIYSGFDETRANTPYKPGKWSPKELLGHLLDCDRIFGTRAMVIARGEKQDLFGFEQDDYVLAGSFNDRTVENLMDEYRGLRASHLALFSGMRPDQAARQGKASDSLFRASELVWVMAGHEIHHLRILEERY